MEKHGIGTDASISVHINTICVRGYVSVQGRARTLVPNDIGIALTHGYCMYHEYEHEHAFILTVRQLQVQAPTHTRALSVSVSYTHCVSTYAWCIGFVILMIVTVVIAVCRSH
jgi:hypothetical protein